MHTCTRAHTHANTHTHPHAHIHRYILIDWLVEVAETKEFPPPTVHMAINLIDRYLLRRKIPTSKLQLLGITALVLGSR